MTSFIKMKTRYIVLFLAKEHSHVLEFPNASENSWLLDRVSYKE